MDEPDKSIKQVLLVSLAGLLYGTAYGAMFFLLPVFIGFKITADFFLIGLLIAVPAIVALVFDLPIGSLSDLVGRKKVMIIGLILVAPLGALLLYVDSLLMFIVFAALFGLLTTFIMPIARALIMDVCPPKKAAQYFGIMLGLIYLGTAIGPLMAGMLIEIPTEEQLMVADDAALMHAMQTFDEGLSAFVMLYLVIGLAAILPMLLVKETVKAKESIGSGIKSIFKSGFFMPAIREFSQLKTLGVMVIYVTFILTIMDGVIWAFEPQLYGEKGLDASSSGLLLFVFVISLVILQPIGGWLADKYGKMKMLNLGMVLGGIFLMLFALQSDETVLMIMATASSFGLALAWPAVSGVITDISINHQRGSIAGVWTLFIDLAYVIGPIVGGVIAAFSGSVSTVFLAMGALLVVSVAPLAFMKSK